VQNYNFFTNPQEVFFLTEKTRTFPKLFGFFGLVRLETVYRDTNSHVMPTLACAMAGIYGCVSLFPFLLLDEK
jgi:hypothetical protein